MYHFRPFTFGYVDKNAYLVKLVKLISKILPTPLQWLAVYRRRVVLNSRIVRDLGNVVHHGPFTGMQMPSRRFWGSTDMASQCLGFYELEVLREIDQSRSKRVLINIGAADGYYAVGWVFGISNLERRSIAFEKERRALSAISELARCNQVEDRIELQGVATSNSLKSLLAQKSFDLNSVLVVCDIEGSEYELFSDELLRELAGAKLIIEIHEFTPELVAARQALEERAARYFQVRKLTSSSRNPHQFVELAKYSDVDRFLICAEGRDGAPGTWIVLE